MRRIKLQSVNVFVLALEFLSKTSSSCVFEALTQIEKLF